jgi:hypothetical protein
MMRAVGPRLGPMVSVSAVLHVVAVGYLLVAGKPQPRLIFRPAYTVDLVDAPVTPSVRVSPGWPCWAGAESRLNSGRVAFVLHARKTRRTHGSNEGVVVGGGSCRRHPCRGDRAGNAALGNRLREHFSLPDKRERH